MKQIIIFLSVLTIFLFAACTHKNDHGNFPDDFSGLSDQEKMTYMMKEVDPDSVARFVVDASLGKIPHVKLQNFSACYSYAYERYSGENQDLFLTVMDEYSKQLPLADNMKIQKMLGFIDQDALGYQLGLEYVGQIREKQLNEAQVTREINDLKRTADSETYSKFLKGFKVAIENDHGKDLPEWLYKKFIDM